MTVNTNTLPRLGRHPSPEQLLAITILLVASLTAYAAYSLGLPGDFLLDDPVRLPGIKPENAGLTELIKETLQNLHGETGRPVSIFSLAFTTATSGPAPGAFKHQNILLHILTGIIQFWALAYLLGQIKRSGPNDAASMHPLWVPAACIAGIWLVHPLFVSTVLYSVQRIAILGALFVWCALLCYVTGRRASAQGQTGRAALLLFAGVPLFALLGLGSKENAALLPVYFLLVNLFTSQSLRESMPGLTMRKAATTVLIVVPFVLGAILFATHVQDFFAGYQFRPFSLFERILTQGYVLWWYIGMIFLPLLRNMTIFHGNHWVATPENVPAYIALVSLLGLAVIAVALRRRAPMIGFGTLLFLGSHLLESTILPLELIFEHRNYVGMSGLFIAVYGAYDTISSRLSRRFLARIAVVVIALAFIGLSTLLAIRSWTWSDNRKLILTSIEEHPSSQRGLTEAANLMLRQQKPLQAFSILKRAIRVSPDDAGPLLHMYALKCQGELSPQYEQAAHEAARHKMLTPYAVNALWNLPGLASDPKCGNLEINDTLDLLRSSLDNPTLTARNRYYFQLRIAKLLSNLGRHAEAMEHIADARKLIPEISLIQRHRAIELEAYIAARQGDLERFRDTIEYYRLLEKQHPYYFAYAHPGFVDSLVDQANKLRPGFTSGSEIESPTAAGSSAD